MAELATLARPYANAAYELAKQSGRVDSWSAALTLLVEAGENAGNTGVDRIAGHRTRSEVSYAE